MSNVKEIDIKELFRSSEIFENLTEAELDRIARHCREEVYEAGTTIFKEGDEAKEFYIVEEGRVALEVTLHIGSGVGRQGIIDVITKGGSFGSSVFCEVNVYTNSARCIEKTRVIVMTGGVVSTFSVLFESDQSSFPVLSLQYTAHMCMPSGTPSTWTAQATPSAMLDELV